MLLPFISIPEKLVGREVVFHINNTAVGNGWNKGYLKNDISATLMLRCINSMAAHLGTKVHVVHVKRMTHELASLADKISRTDRLDREEKGLVAGKFRLMKSKALEYWLTDPVLDWNLPYKMLEEIASII